MAAFTNIELLHSHANAPSQAKSWMDFLGGSMSPKEASGRLSQTGVWWDDTPHHFWATGGGEDCVVEKQRKTSKGICADPEKRKMHENNQIFACHRIAQISIQIHFALFFHHSASAACCSYPAFLPAHLLARSFDNVKCLRDLCSFSRFLFWWKRVKYSQVFFLCNVFLIA